MMLKNKQVECDKIYEIYFDKIDKSKDSKSIRQENITALSDYELDMKSIEYGLDTCAKYRASYNGERPLGNESEDDMRLLKYNLYYGNNNISLAKTVFFNSLHYQTKTDEQKRKIAREDYLDLTISNIDKSETARGNYEKYLSQKKQENQNPKSTVSIDKIKNLTKGISNVNQSKNFEWIIENLFARDFISIFFGEPGCGKTWLLLYISLIVSMGGKLWNNLTVDKAKVMLFEGDTPISMIKERLNKLKMPLDDDYFKYISRYEADEANIDLNLSKEQGRANLELFIKDFMPDIVFIDTLISFINDESNAENIKVVVDNLRLLAKRYHCHIVIIHHSRKRDKGELRSSLDQSDVIGSSVITRLASIVLGVDRNAK